MVGERQFRCWSTNYPKFQPGIIRVLAGWCPIDPQDQQSSPRRPRQVTSQWVHAKLTHPKGSTEAETLWLSGADCLKNGWRAMRGTLIKPRSWMGDPPKVSLLILPSSLCYDHEMWFCGKWKVLPRRHSDRRKSRYPCSRWI